MLQNYLSFKFSKNEKSIVFGFYNCNIGFSFCNNAQVNAEKALQDSLAEVARVDSILQAQADSIQAVIEAEAAAAADTLNQVVEEAASNL